MCSRTISRISRRFNMSRIKLAATTARTLPYRPNGTNPFSIISMASFGSVIENAVLPSATGMVRLDNVLALSRHCHTFCREKRFDLHVGALQNDRGRLAVIIRPRDQGWS